MDHLQRCYSCDMRISLNPEIIARVRWYFCPPGALPLPTNHFGGSKVWESNAREYPHAGLGEVSLDRVWDSGVAPVGVTGQQTETPLEWFRSGVPAEVAMAGPYPNGLCSLPPGAWWHLRAADIPILAEGEEVEEWPDSSPYRLPGLRVGTELVPTFVTDGGKGYPCVKLTNGGGPFGTRLTRGGDPTYTVPGNQQTTFCSAKLVGPPGGGFRLGVDINASVAPGVARTLRQVRINAIGFNTFAAAPLNDWHVWSCRRDGENATILLDGTPVTSGLTHPTASPQLGAIHATGEAVGDGTVCYVDEVIVYERLLLPEEEAAVLSYLESRVIAGVDEMLPGTILAFGGAAAPSGYLPCDGAAVVRDVYPALFAAIGTTWGAGNGTTTFNVPDLRGRFPLGSGAGPGLTARTLAETGGAEEVQLVTAELPAHTHAQQAHTHVQDAHTHTQQAHNHTQDAHTHVQDAHNHTQDAHTHTQDAHTHTQQAHNHGQNAHGHTQGAHTHLQATNSSATGGSVGYAPDASTSGRVVSGYATEPATPTIADATAVNIAATALNDNATATNQNATATNQAATATNQNATATNQAATAVNDNATAVNQAATAVNDPEGGDQAHENMPPFRGVLYIIKT